MSTVDEAIEAAATGWARLPWGAVGRRGRGRGERAGRHRALPDPRGRLGARLRGRARPGRLPRPGLLTAVRSRRGESRCCAGTSCAATSSARVWVGHVAADDERGLWLWFATGSACRDVGAADGRTFREVPFAEWGRTEHAHARVAWSGDVLMLHPPGGGVLGVVLLHRARRRVRRLVREPGAARRPVGRRRRAGRHRHGRLRPRHRRGARPDVALEGRGRVRRPPRRPGRSTGATTRPRCAPAARGWSS